MKSDVRFCRVVTFTSRAFILISIRIIIMLGNSSNIPASFKQILDIRTSSIDRAKAVEELSILENDYPLSIQDCVACLFSKLGNIVTSKAVYAEWMAVLHHMAVELFK